jgi:hypothetical protein
MWYVHYSGRRFAAGMVTVATLELAIQASCTLIERGMVVSEIEGIYPLKGMNAGEIQLACAKRKAK